MRQTRKRAHKAEMPEAARLTRTGLVYTASRYRNAAAKGLASSDE
jgi:hypothetical protein